MNKCDDLICKKEHDSKSKFSILKVVYFYEKL